MTWTPGTWADVAIGDDVLGADGYAWRVTDGLINRFDLYGKGESLRVTMEREPIGARTGDLLASKPVKYQPGEPRGVVISCNDCQYAGKPSCELHAPEPATVEYDAEGRDKFNVVRLAERAGADPVTYDGPDLGTVDLAIGLPVTQANGVTLVSGTVAAPYVEYDDAERAAAAALKGAGLQMTVIERQMTLDGLTEHIGNVHSEPLPGAGGNLTRIELRSRLADLHFQLHEKDQPRGQRWEPRGSTAHVHPVMDRPTGDPEPTSFRAKR